LGRRHVFELAILSSPVRPRSQVAAVKPSRSNTAGLFQQWQEGDVWVTGRDWRELCQAGFRVTSVACRLPSRPSITVARRRARTLDRSSDACRCVRSPEHFPVGKDALLCLAIRTAGLLMAKHTGLGVTLCLDASHPVSQDLHPFCHLLRDGARLQVFPPVLAALTIFFVGPDSRRADVCAEQALSVVMHEAAW
jgi:hypothetical protein